MHDAFIPHEGMITIGKPFVLEYARTEGVPPTQHPFRIDLEGSDRFEPMPNVISAASDLGRMFLASRLHAYHLVPETLIKVQIVEV